jgi:hypothetical protein
MTVEEMLLRISSHELSEWKVFASKEPIGQDREDLRMATLASVIANCNRDPEKRPDPFTPVDFLINFWKEEVEPTIESWKANLQMAEILTAALGGKDLRGQ